MKHRACMSLVVAVSLGLPGAGFAQRTSPQALQGPNLPVNESRRVASLFAQCVVEKNKTQAEEIILKELHNPEIQRQFSRILTSSCLPFDAGNYDQLALQLPEPMLQYLFAGALIRSDPSILVTDPATIAPLNHRALDASKEGIKAGKRLSPKRLKQIEEDRAEALAHLARSYYGECVVRASPEASGALIRSDVSSVAEADAFKTLMPALQSCIPAGKQVSFSREVLRGTIAFNYYRLAKAPRVNPVATK